MHATTTQGPPVDYDALRAQVADLAAKVAEMQRQADARDEAIAMAMAMAGTPQAPARHLSVVGGAR